MCCAKEIKQFDKKHIEEAECLTKDIGKETCAQENSYNQDEYCKSINLDDIDHP